jgi:hypothetical protein
MNCECGHDVVGNEVPRRWCNECSCSSHHKPQTQKDEKVVFTDRYGEPCGTYQEALEAKDREIAELTCYVKSMEASYSKWVEVDIAQRKEISELKAEVAVVKDSLTTQKAELEKKRKWIDSANHLDWCDLEQLLSEKCTCGYEEAVK